MACKPSPHFWQADRLLRLMGASMSGRRGFKVPGLDESAGKDGFDEHNW